MDEKLVGYVVGVIDSEGSFSVSVKLQKTTAYGVRLDPVFSITQAERAVLERVRQVVGVGRIRKKPGQKHLWLYIVDSYPDLLVLTTFLDAHIGLLIAKRRSYEVFREIVSMLTAGRHKTLEGLIEVLKLVDSLSKLNPKSRRRRDIDQIITLLRTGREPPGDR